MVRRQFPARQAEISAKVTTSANGLLSVGSLDDVMQLFTELKGISPAIVRRPFPACPTSISAKVTTSVSGLLSVGFSDDPFQLLMELKAGTLDQFFGRSFFARVTSMVP